MPTILITNENVKKKHDSLIWLFIYGMNRFADNVIETLKQIFTFQH